MITIWILAITTFLLGYILGNYKGDNLVGDVVEGVKNRFSRVEVGAINKPAPEELVNRGTILEETEQEMEKLLDEEFENEKAGDKNV